MKEIYIKPASEWLKMEMDEGTVVALSFQLANIGDASIYANRSSNISFPNTAVNRLNIQNAQIPNSSGTMQYEKTLAKYIEDGIDLLQDCYLIINSIKITIDATLYSGNFDLISTLAEKKLNLNADYGTEDLTEFDLMWEAATVDSQKAVTVGVKYPLIDWFSDSPWEAPEYFMSESVRTMWVKYYRPAIFLQSIIDKIITGHGFTYGSLTSPILLNTLYLKAIIPVINNLLPAEYEMGETDIVTPQSFNAGDPEAKLLFDVLHTTFVNDTTYTEFIATASGNYRFDFLLELLYYISTPGNLTAVFKVYNDTDEIDTFQWTINYSVQGTYFEAHSVEVYLNEGDRVNIGVYGIYDVIGWPAILGITSMSWNATSLDHIGVKMVYNIANNLPDITQLELLKWFMQMFGCFIKQTKDKTIWFKTIDEFIADCGSPNNAANWSDKFAPEEEPEINFVTELAQKNDFKYTEDDPMAGTKYDSSIAIDDKTIQPENTYVQSPFAASEWNGRMGSLRFPSIKAIKEFDWSESFQPRILIDDFKTPSGGAITVDDGFDTATISANFPLCFFVNPTAGQPDLTMQSLIAENYVGFGKVFNHPKIIKQRFWLSIMDIYNLDQFIPIYCKQLGGYFIVMKVVNWIKGEATECELLKIV
jgi:hypothetical protein